jgi:hypothetical protein
MLLRLLRTAAAAAQRAQAAAPEAVPLPPALWDAVVRAVLEGQFDVGAGGVEASLAEHSAAQHQGGEDVLELVTPTVLEVAAGLPAPAAPVALQLEAVRAVVVEGLPLHVVLAAAAEQAAAAAAEQQQGGDVVPATAGAGPGGGTAGTGEREWQGQRGHGAAVDAGWLDHARAVYRALLCEDAV